MEYSTATRWFTTYGKARMNARDGRDDNETRTD